MVFRTMLYIPYLRKSVYHAGRSFLNLKLFNIEFLVFLVVW